MSYQYECGSKPLAHSWRKSLSLNCPLCLQKHEDSDSDQSAKYPEKVWASRALMPLPAAPSPPHELELQQRRNTAAWASGLALLLVTLIVCNADNSSSTSSISLLETSLSSSASRTSALRIAEGHPAGHAQLSHALSNLAMLKERYNSYAAGQSASDLAQEEQDVFAKEEAVEHEKIEDLKQKLAKEKIRGDANEKHEMTKWQHLQLEAVEELKHVSVDEKVALFHSKKVFDEKKKKAVARQKRRDGAILWKEVTTTQSHPYYFLMYTHIFMCIAHVCIRTHACIYGRSAGTVRYFGRRYRTTHSLTPTTF